MSNEAFLPELSIFTPTKKDWRLAPLLEPKPKHTPRNEAGGGERQSVKRLWFYDFFNHYDLQDGVYVKSETTPGWMPHRFTHDMNAALRAEGALPKKARKQYIRQLMSIVTGEAKTIEDEYWLMRRATPEQIVDALLAVLEAEPAPIPTT